MTSLQSLAKHPGTLILNPGLWLILKALLKNGVAEGVASDPHDPSAGEALAKPRFLDLPALASGAFDS